MSIQPKWCELIASGNKTIEVRKTRPKLDVPFKCYIYCTKDKTGRLVLRRGNVFLGYREAVVSGKVIGEFVCDEIYELHDWHLDPRGAYQEIEEENLKKLLKMSQLTYDELCLYRNGMPYYKPLYVWHISDLIIYDEPKELSDFTHACPDNVKACKMCRHTVDGMKCKPITRPPQSWCYVEK